MTERVTQLTGNETTVGTKRPWVRNDRVRNDRGYSTTGNRFSEAMVFAHQFAKQ